MILENFFKLRISLVFIAAFGVFTGILGYGYSKLPEKLSDPQQQLLGFLLSTVSIGALGLVNNIVSREITAETKDQLEEKVQAAMNDYEKRYSEDVKTLKDDFFALNIPEETREKIEKKFVAIQSADGKFKTHLKASQDIVKWLEVKENRLSLLDAALSTVSTNSIPDDHRTVFEKDIRECIHWLRYSIKALQVCTVEQKRQASAITTGILSEVEPYETALNAIKEYKQIKEFSVNTPIVEEMIGYLIQEITKKQEHDS